MLKPDYSFDMISITQSKTFVLTIIASVLLIVYFIFTSQFWATYWFFSIPVGFMVLLFFLSVFIDSISHWKRNSNINRQSYIPFLINIVAIVIVLFLPSHNRSKRYYKGSGTLCNYKTGNCGCNLYAEYYRVYEQGAWGTGLNSMYLIDSLNFKKYLGVYDERFEHIDVACKGDSIIVTKTSTEFISTQWSNPKLLERKFYSLSKLKKSHDFD